MSTLAMQAPESPIAEDDFLALEERILRAVEMVKTERAARIAAEAKLAEFHESLEAHTNELLRAEALIETLRSERDLVRTRIERLLGQLDELAV